MHKPPLLSSNFAHLQEHDAQLLRLGMLAERYFPDDPNTSRHKLRQLTELLALLVATKVGVYESPEESQSDLLRRLQDQGILPREIAQLFVEVRRAGNAASHALVGDHRTALATLKITWQLGLWFHRTFRHPSYKSGPFIPPQAPPDESTELRAELTRLSQALEQDRAAHQETAQRLAAAEARLREAKDEQTFWEQMASEVEAAKAALEQRLAAQQAAIQAAEAAIARGQRDMLLAMATGTGKTKTSIALIYRLLKAQRFRRVLFLVDRSALGEQGANAFKDTRMESLQTFADIFGIKELDEQKPDTDTTVHIATVQGMVQRALYPGEDEAPPPVDQYDCIVVDECHRGYLLDRELSDTELSVRSYDDYISKYRRVLDYFDAVKIGLTATPALHTTQIFGAPIFTYSYREAVIDGYLVDHEPPLQITTELSTSGIVWKVGEEVEVYHVHHNQLDLFTTPDEIKLDVEDFNRKVITESFNRVVCEFLAQGLDPSSRQKTLIFCVNDAHANLVVYLLKKAFAQHYGSIDDDAVIKITGAADKPLQLIRRYKNERNPNVAVTVDLLTTGVDVPEICNLVFLRRVNSRILFDQMLGRATRRCDEIGKETFRIFDAVKIYEALQGLTAMQPVVVNPAIIFTQLARELVQVTSDAERALVRDQFVAKLQRRKRHLSEAAVRDFETCAGMPPDAFIKRLKSMPLADIAAWFTHKSDLGEILDRQGEGHPEPVFVSHHDDRLLGTERGYGRAKRPEDYLQEFSDFIRSRSNAIPALITVLTRPRDLTRKQLRELALELNKAGFSEASLATAWREMTNQDIAARIVGYIRQAAIGDPLVPYDQRVDNALQKLLASRQWSTPQRQWLQRIAAQTKANMLVDREALDDPDLVFRREGGGFARLDRIFGGELQQVLDTFNESLWATA
jgi:type I restriction enzyme R subunit